MGLSTSKVDIWNRALSRIGESAQLQSETDDRVAARLCKLHWHDVVTEVLEAHPWPWARKQATLTAITGQSNSEDGDGTQKDFQIPFAFSSWTQITVYEVDASGNETELTAVTDYTRTAASGGASAYITLTGDAPASDEAIKITCTVEREGWDYVYSLPADCVTPIALLPTDTRYEELNVDERYRWEIVPDDVAESYLLCCNYESDEFVLQYVALVDYIPLWPRHFAQAVTLRLAAELAPGLKSKHSRRELLVEYEYVLDRAAAHAENANEFGPPPETPSVAARG